MLFLLQVGFWTIKVVAEGQSETKQVKVEKHYLPLGYELVVTSPPFALTSDERIEASVDGAFITERIAKGNITVVWKAKLFDGLTPMYNDTQLYRDEYRKAAATANVYRTLAYSGANGRRTDKVFFDPYSNLSASAVPERPIENQ